MNIQLGRLHIHLSNLKVIAVLTCDIKILDNHIGTTIFPNLLRRWSNPNDSTTDALTYDDGLQVRF